MVCKKLIQPSTMTTAFACADGSMASTMSSQNPQTGRSPLTEAPVAIEERLVLPRLHLAIGRGDAVLHDPIDAQKIDRAAHAYRSKI